MIAEKLVAILKENSLSIAAAESCTGGAFMAALVRVSGASDVFSGGIVAYSLDAKVKQLSVTRETLDEFDVVSEQVAGEMAIGARKKFGADIGIGITGYAGPSGERVGEVCFGLCIGEQVFALTQNFSGTREQVIDESVKFLIGWLCDKFN